MENIRKQDPHGGHDIRGAGTEARHPGIAVHAKEVVAVDKDSAIADAVRDLRPGGGGVTRN
jgi:hypothetical protein